MNQIFDFAKKYWIYIAALTAVLLIIYFYKKLSKMNLKIVWDAISEKRIKELHPKIQDKVRQFINEAENQGIFLRIVSGLRDMETQRKIYAQGRTEPGAIISNAQPGWSFHNYGLAIDVVPIVDNKAIWNSKDWDKIGQIGKSFGFRWGGDFKSLSDKPHFEYSFNKTIAQIKSLYENNNTNNGWVTV